MAKDLKANSDFSVLTVFLEMLDRDFLGVVIWKTSYESISNGVTLECQVWSGSQGQREVRLTNGEDR